MDDCVFCRIIAGAIPSWVVYRDAQTICFLAKEPEAYGHTLIVPIAHCPDIYAAEPGVLAALLATAQKLAVHYRERIGATGVNLLHASGVAAQQSVGHLHIHLLPRFADDGLNAWPVLPGAKADKDALLRTLRYAAAS